jgi:hypothetical protein
MSSSVGGSVGGFEGGNVGGSVGGFEGGNVGGRTGEFEGASVGAPRPKTGHCPQRGAFSGRNGERAEKKFGIVGMRETHHEKRDISNDDEL